MIAVARPPRITFASMTPTTVNHSSPILIDVPRAGAWPKRRSLTSAPITPTFLASTRSTSVRKRPSTTRKFVTSAYSGFVPTAWAMSGRPSTRTSASTNRSGATADTAGIASRMNTASESISLASKPSIF